MRGKNQFEFTWGGGKACSIFMRTIRLNRIPSKNVRVFKLSKGLI